jgi:hypothetical protein
MLSPSMLVPCFPINMENRDLGWRVGTVFDGFRQFGALSGGLRKHVVVIIHKSNDQFMEQPPMKTVQPWGYMGMAWCSMWERLVWCTNWWCGLSEALGIHLVGNEWVKEWTLLKTTQCKRGPLVIWTNTSGETSAGALLTRLNHWKAL